MAGHAYYSHVFEVPEPDTLSHPLILGEEARKQPGLEGGCDLALLDSLTQPGPSHGYPILPFRVGIHVLQNGIPNMAWLPTPPEEVIAGLWSQWKVLFKCTLLRGVLWPWLLMLKINVMCFPPTF